MQGLVSILISSSCERAPRTGDAPPGAASRQREIDFAPDTMLVLDVTALWLPAALPAPVCAALSSRLYDLELSHLSLVKAFHPSGSAESLAPVATGLDWVCQYGACAKIAGHTAATTLHSAVVVSRGPLSARVASSAHATDQKAAAASSGADDATSTALPVLRPDELHSFLASLHAMTGRSWRDADVYLTKASSPSASLGWHIDDVDVLLVLLSGTKRCVRFSWQSACGAHVYLGASAPGGHLAVTRLSTE